MKKIILLILIIIQSIFFVSCKNIVNEKIYIDEVTPITLCIGERLNGTIITYDYESDLLIGNQYGVFANKCGSIMVKIDGKDYFATITDEIVKINSSSKQRLIVGESTKIISDVYPKSASQEVVYQSNNTDVLIVDEFGTVESVNEGVAVVKISSKENMDVFTELVFIVINDDEQSYDSLLELYFNEINDNITENDPFSSIVNSGLTSLVGIEAIRRFQSITISNTFGSGMIYRVDAIKNNDEVLERITTIEEIDDIKTFRYYVVTNKHIIEKGNIISIYLKDQLIQGKLIQWDDKIDLAVVTFEYNEFIPPIRFGNSDEIEKGEFVISVGNGFGKEYYHSSSFGIVSSPSRYISTDTDGDLTNDWDSQYIQYDATLNSSDSGGALINLKGEVIGINSTSITDFYVNNMSFSIPSNLVVDIISMLERGEKPQRATLGVSIVDVHNYQTHRDYYLVTQPEIQIPESLEWGFYISSVDKGKVGDRAKMIIGDIIIGINGEMVKYSYELRAELSKHIIGSGDVIEIDVLRNNQVVTLTVVF